MSFWQGQMHSNYKFKPTPRDFRSAFGHSWQHEESYRTYFLGLIALVGFINLVLWS